jgi:hypothetical protein
MMKPPPATTFEVPQAEFLFELFIVAFDDPAVLGGANQIGKFRFGRQSGKPILGWFLVVLGPSINPGGPYERGEPQNEIGASGWFLASTPRFSKPWREATSPLA